MPIQVSQTPAQMGWDVQKASLSQSGNGAWALDIEAQKPMLEITSKKPQILIDQRQPFAEAGLKNIQAFMEDATALSRQIWIQGIARIVSDGNTWINIHTGVDPIPDQAIYNAYEMFDKEFNYGTIPTSRPRIELDEGRINYRFIKGEVINRSTPVKVQMDYQPWRINYYMKQYNSIQFNYIKSNVSWGV